MSIKIHQPAPATNVTSQALHINLDSTDLAFAHLGGRTSYASFIVGVLHPPADGNHKPTSLPVVTTPKLR